MAAVLADIRRIAPEFATVSDSDVTAFLADAATEMNATTWGVLYNKGQMNLAAHLIAVAHPELTTGVSEKTGDTTITYVAAQGDSGGYEQTRYGREYRRLRRKLGLGIQVA